MPKKGALFWRVVATTERNPKGLLRLPGAINWLSLLYGVMCLLCNINIG